MQSIHTPVFADTSVPQVINPQTTSAVPEEWHVQSYEDLRLGRYELW